MRGNGRIESLTLRCSSTSEPDARDERHQRSLSDYETLCFFLPLISLSRFLTLSLVTIKITISMSSLIRVPGRRKRARAEMGVCWEKISNTQRIESWVYKAQIYNFSSVPNQKHGRLSWLYLVQYDVNVKKKSTIRRKAATCVADILTVLQTSIYIRRDRFHQWQKRNGKVGCRWRPPGQLFLHNKRITVCPDAVVSPRVERVIRNVVGRRSCFFLHFPVQSRSTLLLRRAKKLLLFAAVSLHRV